MYVYRCFQKKLSHGWYLSNSFFVGFYFIRCCKLFNKWSQILRKEKRNLTWYRTESSWRTLLAITQLCVARFIRKGTDGAWKLISGFRIVRTVVTFRAHVHTIICHLVLRTIKTFHTRITLAESFDRTVLTNITRFRALATGNTKMPCRAYTTIPGFAAVRASFVVQAAGRFVECLVHADRVGPVHTIFTPMSDITETCVCWRVLITTVLASRARFAVYHAIVLPLWPYSSPRTWP